MKATFTRAARYTVRAECLTPLRTAGADSDTESVLRRGERAMLQGSSLAGALREWARSNLAPGAEDALFGQSLAEKRGDSPSGTLVFSDALFDPEAESAVRPRLRIDGAAGSADEGGKFDVAHICAGASFTFTLFWLGDEAREGQKAQVETMLAALNAGEIRLGAQKSNGFGRVRLRVTRREYNMLDAADRRAWLDEREDGKLLALPEAPAGRRVEFTLSGAADSLLVRAAAVESDEGKAYIPNLSEGGRALLPGSSVKGAVRSRAELIARRLGVPREVTDRLFGACAARGEDSLPGVVFFEDAALGRTARRITRIRINRFTGGVLRGGRFTEEPLSGALSLRVSVPADNGAGCALVLYALRDLGLGLYGLGSGWAVGRGFLRDAVLEAAAPDGRRLRLRFDADGNCRPEDPDALAASWREALEEVRV